MNEAKYRLVRRYLNVMENWDEDMDAEDLENEIRDYPYVAIGELLDIIENL